jgi:hypothetical protein
LKKREPLFDEESSKLLHQRKQDKLQWLEDPSRNKLGQSEQCNYVKTADISQKKRRYYLKDKINEPATNIKNKNI